MGRDKAAAADGRGATLVEHVAGCVRAAAGSVTLVGAAGTLYAAGARGDCRSLRGLRTPRRRLYGPGDHARGLELDRGLRHAGRDGGFPGRVCWLPPKAAGADCLIPETADGLHPLCAVYHRRARDPLRRRQILDKCFKMHDFVASLRAAKFPVPGPFSLENVNTPQDWASR